MPKDFTLCQRRFPVMTCLQGSCQTRTQPTRHIPVLHPLKTSRARRGRRPPLALTAPQPQRQPWGHHLTATPGYIAQASLSPGTEQAQDQLWWPYIQRERGRCISSARIATQQRKGTSCRRHAPATIAPFAATSLDEVTAKPFPHISTMSPADGAPSPWPRLSSSQAFSTWQPGTQSAGLASNVWHRLSE